MKMTSGKRAIDKIYKRRDRYEIPDWQRDEVWDDDKKRILIDSMLRGWKLPKFYFFKTSEDSYEVVDGQQRLSTICEFFSNELGLDEKSTKIFGGPNYDKLKHEISDAFDDYEIEYDIIEDATEKELKEFFQRLQAGLPLTSSEKLNAIHSKLRNYCKEISEHDFFGKVIAVPDTRYAHFDIASKVATIEIEGLDAGIRFSDVKYVFESNSGFSSTSAVGKRIQTALDILFKAFKGSGKEFRTRTVVQSLITLTCHIVATGRHKGCETDIRDFFTSFSKELSREVEKGHKATDSDYIKFQSSINANIKGGTRIRHEVMLRKMFSLSPRLVELFDASILSKAGFAGRINELGDSISAFIFNVNKMYSAKHGEDLFKPTSRTSRALLSIRNPIKSIEDYKTFIDDLYFLFKESIGVRMEEDRPSFISDINDLRTDIRHDVDHGNPSKIRSKRKKLGNTYERYAGSGIPETTEPSRFPLIQANLLSCIETNLKKIVLAP